MQQDARISYSELGRRVSLSAPAVQERIRKLEDAGIIKGYHAALDLEQLGLPIKAIIQMIGPCRSQKPFIEAIQNLPQVLQCHAVLGEKSFYLLVAVASMQGLEALKQELHDYGDTITTIVLSSPIEHPIISPKILS